MIPSEELQHFLDDLNDRRQRLMRLAEPVDVDESVMRGELVELSERLAVADEEMRVQQEEVDRARSVAESVSLGYADLVDSAPDALVLTDENGAVLRSSRSARALVATSTRPIATWFQVVDRTAVRSAISAAKRSGQNTVDLGRLTVRCADGHHAEVLVSVTVVVRLSERHRRLLWRLTPLRRQKPTLHIVPEDGAGDEVRRPEADVVGLTDVTVQLARATSLDAVLETIAESARRFIPAAVSAGVHFPDRDAAARPDRVDSARSGSWDSALRHLNELQRGLGEGPAVEALSGHETVTADLAADLRWPRLGTVVPEHLRAVMAVPLAAGGPPLAALTVASDRVDAFDESAVRAAQIFSIHAAVALQRAKTEESLRRAVQARQLIGQAVGVLIERYRIDAEAAFDLLREASQTTNTKISRLAGELLQTGRVPGAVARLAQVRRDA